MTNLYNETKTKIPPIDPFNPFGNQMENTDYNGDYAEIVPQISTPGCILPLQPNKREKKSIRRYYNIAGWILLIFSFISQFVPAVIEMMLYIIAEAIDKGNGIDTTTQAYYYNFFDYLSQGSSVQSAILIIVHLVFNVTLALIGLKLINIKLPELFQTTDLHKKDIIIYIFAAFFIQYSLSLVMNAIVMLFENNGVEIVTTDTTSTGNIKAIFLDWIYVCVIAPVTEELLFRGFALKALSRVSQRFAVLMSAFLFGLIHGNISQFVVAFALGIFFGMIDIKHNSLVPSMILHFCINTFAEIMNYSMLVDGTIGYVIESILNILIFLMLAAGFVCLILYARKNRLPYNTPHQSMRSNALVFGTPSVMLLIGFNVLLIIWSNVSNNMG